MKRYRSTSLKLSTKHCPKALSFAEANTPFDRDIFAAGTVAHACAQAFVEHGFSDEVADDVVRELSQHGRSFDGVPEPPLSVEACIKGRDIALTYFRDNPPPTENAFAEIGLGMNRNGEPAPYMECDYAAAIDLVEFVEEEEEEWFAKGAIHTDYKSAWPTSEEELDTLQLRGQSVLVFKKYGKGLDFIEQRVISLRLRMEWSRRLYLDDADDRALLERWEKDIWLECEAAEASRVARPGAGCLDCPYILECDDSLTTMGREDVAEALAALEGRRGALLAMAKKMYSEEGVEIPGGFVGYKRQLKRAPVEDIHSLVAEEWGVTDGAALGLLKALKMGAGNVGAVIRVLTKKKDERKDLEEKLLTTKAGRRFGVHKA